MFLAGLSEETCKKMLSCEAWSAGEVGGSWQRIGVRAIKKYRDGQEVTFYFWQDPSNASCLRVRKEFTDLFRQHIAPKC